MILVSAILIQITMGMRIQVDYNTIQGVDNSWNAKLQQLVGYSAFYMGQVL
jgi:hypothetical protein